MGTVGTASCAGLANQPGSLPRGRPGGLDPDLATAQQFLHRNREVTLADALGLGMLGEHGRRIARALLRADILPLHVELAQQVQEPRFCLLLESHAVKRRDTALGDVGARFPPNRHADAGGGVVRLSERRVRSSGSGALPSVALAASK